MSKNSKTLSRIAQKPTVADIRWDELSSALESVGYECLNNDGSRRKFFHKGVNDLITLHKPHPSPDVAKYAIEEVREHLKLHGLI